LASDKRRAVAPFAQLHLFEDAAVALIIIDFDQLDVVDRVVGKTLWRFGEGKVRISLSL
jgi:hypothetical protein